VGAEAIVVGEVPGARGVVAGKGEMSFLAVLGDAAARNSFFIRSSVGNPSSAKNASSFPPYLFLIIGS